MHGYSAHTFKWVNEQGEAFLVKYTFKTDQGIKNFTFDEALTTGGYNAYYSSQELYEAIAKGNFPSWTMYVQVMPEAQAETYKWDVYDVTKVWPHADYPLMEVGKLTLGKLPINYFAEVEQVAFSPANLVPGIEPTPDRLLQGRLFLYQDTQLHRLGANYDQIPINCPFSSQIDNFIQDGKMNVNQNQKKQVGYYQNSMGVNLQGINPEAKLKDVKVEGLIGRYEFKHSNVEFEQVRQLYRNVLKEPERKNLIYNICKSLGQCIPEIQ